MNTEQPVKRDERTVAVENAGYKWAYLFLAWPLAIDAYSGPRKLDHDFKSNPW
jgi:hypothetical protein